MEAAVPTPDEDEDDMSKFSFEDWFFLSIRGVILLLVVDRRERGGMNELVADWLERLAESNKLLNK